MLQRFIEVFLSRKAYIRLYSKALIPVEWDYLAKDKSSFKNKNSKIRKAKFAKFMEDLCQREQLC